MLVALVFEAKKDVIGFCMKGDMPFTFQLNSLRTSGDRSRCFLASASTTRRRFKGGGDISRSMSTTNRWFYMRLLGTPRLGQDTHTGGLIVHLVWCIPCQLKI